MTQVGGKRGVATSLGVGWMKRRLCLLPTVTALLPSPLSWPPCSPAHSPCQPSPPLHLHPLQTPTGASSSTSSSRAPTTTATAGSSSSPTSPTGRGSSSRPSEARPSSSAGEGRTLSLVVVTYSPLGMVTRLVLPFACLPHPYCHPHPRLPPSPLPHSHPRSPPHPHLPQEGARAVVPHPQIH